MFNDAASSKFTSYCLIKRTCTACLKTFFVHEQLAVFCFFILNAISVPQMQLQVITPSHFFVVESSIK